MLKKKNQVQEISKIVGCLNNTIWRNKHIKIETKSRIHKVTIGPSILTCTAETQLGTSKTQRLLEMVEMRILRIQGNMLRDRIRSDKIRWKCSVVDINKWILNRNREWNDHISRMADSRVLKIARNELPVGK